MLCEEGGQGLRSLQLPSREPASICIRPCPRLSTSLLPFVSLEAFHHQTSHTHILTLKLKVGAWTGGLEEGRADEAEQDCVL